MEARFDFCRSYNFDTSQQHFIENMDEKEDESDFSSTLRREKNDHRAVGRGVIRCRDEDADKHLSMEFTKRVRAAAAMPLVNKKPSLKNINVDKQVAGCRSWVELDEGVNYTKKVHRTLPQVCNLISIRIDKLSKEGESIKPNLKRERSTPSLKGFSTSPFLARVSFLESILKNMRVYLNAGAECEIVQGLRDSIFNIFDSFTREEIYEIFQENLNLAESIYWYAFATENREIVEKIRGANLLAYSKSGRAALACREILETELIFSFTDKDLYGRNVFSYLSNNLQLINTIKERSVFLFCEAVKSNDEDKADEIWNSFEFLDIDVLYLSSKLDSMLSSEAEAIKAREFVFKFSGNDYLSDWFESLKHRDR